MIGIYCIRNTINNKRYVGQSRDLDARRNHHFYMLRKNKHDSDHLQKSWNKYSEINFVFEILEETLEHELGSRESYWINYFNTLDDSCGYNKCDVNNNGGHYVSNSTKQLLREFGKLQFSSVEARQNHAQITKEVQGSQVGCNNRFFGKKHSPETLEKIRLARSKQKIVHSEETKRKISESNKITKSKK